MKFKLFSKKKAPVEINVTDLVLMAMSLLPDNERGIKGEMNIHELLYVITDIPEFSMYKDKLNFKTKPTIFSPTIHATLKDISSDIAVLYPEDLNASTPAKPLFSDSLRFEDYAKVMENELEFSKNIPNYDPKIYMLTSLGRIAAVAVLEGKLSKKQKIALRNNL